MILGGKLPGKVGRRRFIWLHGQAVKTPPFHGGNPGSIPGGVTKPFKKESEIPFFYRYAIGFPHKLKPLQKRARLAELADALDLGSSG